MPRPLRRPDELGTPSARRAQLRRGEVIRPWRGLYLVGGEPLDETSAWYAALEMCGRDAKLSHITALAAWGVRIRCSCGRVDEIHLTAPRSVLPRPGLRPHRRRLDDRPVLERAGLRLASLEEAAVGAWTQLAPCCRRELVTKLIRERRTTADRLLTEAARWGRFAGAPTFRDWTGLAAAGCHSPVELDFVLLVERPFGLPPAARQTPFRRHGVAAFGDVFYELARLLVELDGRDDHSSDETRRADLERDVELAARDGVMTLRFTGRQVRGRSSWVADAILATIRHRTGQGF